MLFHRLKDHTLKHLSRPLHLVLIGIAFNIIAAFLSHSVVSHNNEKIEDRRMETMRAEQQINQTWQNIQYLERKRETLLIFTTVADNAHTKLKDYAAELVRGTDIALSAPLPDNNREAFAALNARMLELKQQWLARINDAYDAQQHVEQKIAALKQRNATWTGLALFLQILGLILILTKDVAKFVEYVAEA